VSREFTDATGKYPDCRGHDSPWHTVRRRFFEKVKKTKKCWLWTGHKDPNGYGRIAMGRELLEKSHRMSYMIHKGPIPKGLVVMHICDNPPCVNPDHLQIGTNADNLNDSYKKGRHKMRAGGKYARVN
jgi:hypothetical protein